MLSARDKELLTAHADGELTARQRRHVDRLLRRSEEARTLLEQLQRDGSQLRSLPRLTVPVDLSSDVLDAITRLGIRPKRRLRPAPQPASFALWQGFAAAAAVLLLVGLGSFLLHSSSDSSPDEGTGSIAQNTPEDLPRSEGKQKGIARVPHDPDLPQRPALPGSGNDGSNKDASDDPPDLPVGPEKPVPSVPERKETDVLTAGGKEPFGKFEQVELSLPTVFEIHRLARVDQGKKLFDQLSQATSSRVEIPSRDASRGFDRVRAAFSARKINLVLDPAAQTRLRRPSWKTDLALFVENVTPREAADLLTAIGEADRLAGEKKASDQRFDGTLVVKDLSRWDRKELSDLLGIDPVSIRPAPPGRKVGMDIRRPLPDVTEEQVSAALEGKGVPRPGATAIDNTAYVMPLSGPRTRPVELKRFLDGRKPALPGTIQLFLVLRNVAG